MTTLSLEGFVRHLASLGAQIERAQRQGLERAAQIVEDEAKEIIGNQQAAVGPFPAWDPLAESTVEGFRGHPGKADLGHSPPDYDPLERTGEMRDSIEHQVTSSTTAHVGSNDDAAVFDELGTSKMAARSFLARAAFVKRDEIGKEIGRRFSAVLSGRAIGKDP